MIRESDYLVVLTGAGVSTESGLPDFRSPGSGLWADASLMELLSASTLWSQPQLFYTRGLELLEQLTRAEPNPAHRVLAAWETQGTLATLITQNIDGLHHRAGSRRLLEVHGQLRTASCCECTYGTSFTGLVQRVRAHGIPPLCPDCRGWLRPDVVLFEDPMPAIFTTAVEEVQRCDMLLVVGSSLRVAPVAYLPQLSRRLAMINLSVTPYDQLAEVVVTGRAGQELEKLDSLLAAPGASR